MTDNAQIFIGNIVTGAVNDENLVTYSALGIVSNFFGFFFFLAFCFFGFYSFLVVKNGEIIACGPPDEILEHYDGEITKLSKTQIMAPGFIDG